MRILILGGTIFLGRHVAAEALARGHELTLYTRGLHGADLFPEAEHVRGDRADLAPLQGRAWDAVIDTSGYESAHVAASARLDAGHYVFVSSCNVYPDWPDKPVDEDSPTWQGGDDYGQQKAASERAAEAAMPGRFATVRAGLIVGPHDNVFRLPWWVARIARGGEIPAFASRGMQLIDARDLATFMLDLAERGTAGAFNGTAPIGQTTFAEVFELTRAATGSDARPHWIGDEQLEAAGVEPWIELPLWLPERYEGTWRVGTDRAQAAGLRTRPLHETIAEIAAWLRGDPRLPARRAEHRPPPMSAEREAELLRL
jgi:nucleoside-diphosphate-sugar epimerase